MTADDLKCETITRLKQAFERAADPYLQDAYEGRSGSALTNGWDTLRHQWLYVMGHNPGGDLVTHHSSKYSIRGATEGLKRDATGLNKEGSYRFNGVVRPLIEGFGQDPDRTFVTNALFVRSRETSDIASEEDAIFAACWPIHEWFLSIVKPRLILCLGYQQDPKRRLPFRRIIEKMNPPSVAPIEMDGQRFGIWADGKLPIGNQQLLPVALAAVYHPSAWQSSRWTSERLRLFKNQIAPQLRSMLG